MMVSFFISKKTFRSVFANNSVFNLHFMKVSTENGNNFGYEKITIVVDNENEIYKILNKKFEDTKGVIRSHNLKDRQYNDKKKNTKRTSKD